MLRLFKGESNLVSPKAQKEVFILDRAAADITMIPKRKCCVPGCEDKYSVRHTLPVKEVDLFNLWIKRIGNDLLPKLDIKTLRNNYRICDLHFPDFCKIKTSQRLMKYSLPTIKVPGFKGVPTNENSFLLPKDCTCQSNTNFEGYKKKYSSLIDHDYTPKIKCQKIDTINEQSVDPLKNNVSCSSSNEIKRSADHNNYTINTKRQIIDDTSEQSHETEGDSVPDTLENDTPIENVCATASDTDTPVKLTSPKVNKTTKIVPEKSKNGYRPVKYEVNQNRRTANISLYKKKYLIIMEKCTLCKIQFVSLKDFVQCTVCENFWHIKCTPLKKVKQLKHKLPLIKKNWLCVDCNKDKITEDMMENIQEINKKISNIETKTARIDTLETAIECYSNRLNDTAKILEDINSSLLKTVKENVKLKEENVRLKIQVMKMDQQFANKLKKMSK